MYAHLGIGKGHISVDQLSLIGGIHRNWHSLQGRLFHGASDRFELWPGWLTYYFSGQWFQVDLYILHEISAIITQGSAYHFYSTFQASVSLSNDTSSWTSIKNEKSNLDEVR